MYKFVLHGRGSSNMDSFEKCKSRACKGAGVQSLFADIESQIEQRAKSTDKMPCPPDSRELGRSTWTYLHSLAAHYPDKPGADEKKEMSSFVRTFARTYPCHYCADHMQEYIQDKEAE